MAGRRTAHGSARNKALAIAAAGTVLVGGVSAASLAAWTDIEWVAGGAGSTAGVLSSTFEVEQFTASDTEWGQYETQGVANVVDFTAEARALAPGDTVYGYVRLRTVVDSLGGSLSLDAVTTVTPDTLSDALEYGAWVIDDFADCDEDVASVAGAVELVAPGSALSADGSGSFALGASDGEDPGTERAVCFAIGFPSSYQDDDGLQGATVTPVWSFPAISVG